MVQFDRRIFQHHRGSAPGLAVGAPSPAGREPDDVAKIGIGAALAAASAGLMVAAMMAGAGRVNALVPFLALPAWE